MCYLYIKHNGLCGGTLVFVFFFLFKYFSASHSHHGYTFLETGKYSQLLIETRYKSPATGVLTIPDSGESVSLATVRDFCLEILFPDFRINKNISDFQLSITLVNFSRIFHLRR